MRIKMIRTNPLRGQFVSDSVRQLLHVQVGPAFGVREVRRMNKSPLAAASAIDDTTQPQSVLGGIQSTQLRPRQAAEALGVSVATIWRWHANRADFPRARKLSRSVTTFDSAELEAWRYRQPITQSRSSK